MRGGIAKPHHAKPDHVLGGQMSFQNCDYIIWSILGINIVVWMMWQLRKYFDLERLLMTYFVSFPDRPLVSLVLSSFSHVLSVHLHLNMAVFMSLAPIVARQYGCIAFLTVYMSGAFISSMSSMGIRAFRGAPPAVSVGASGAIMALFGLLTASNGHRKLAISLLHDVIPHAIPALYFLKALLLFDVLGIMYNWRYIDHGSHFGGCLFGVLCAAFLHRTDLEVEDTAFLTHFTPGAAYGKLVWFAKLWMPSLVF